MNLGNEAWAPQKYSTAARMYVRGFTDATVYPFVDIKFSVLLRIRVRMSAQKAAAKTWHDKQFVVLLWGVLALLPFLQSALHIFFLAKMT